MTTEKNQPLLGTESGIKPDRLIKRMAADSTGQTVAPNGQTPVTAQPSANDEGKGDTGQTKPGKPPHAIDPEPRVDGLKTAPSNDYEASLGGYPKSQTAFSVEKSPGRL